MIWIALLTVLTATLASLLSCIPGLHVYNLIAVVLLIAGNIASTGININNDILIALTCGAVSGFAASSAIPSILLSAPDESALFTVRPGRKYLVEGRGPEAVMLVALGSACGMILLCLVLVPLASRVLPAMYTVLGPHFHWIVWCVIVFMVMSEWPRHGELTGFGWARFRASWLSLGMGIITFLLSGWLGFIIFFRCPINHKSAFQNLMPACIGLFTLPWLITNIFSRSSPSQQYSWIPRINSGAIVRGVAAGALGGCFAAFVPGVTGGTGGLLAGQAAAIRDDRTFLVSQGTCRTIYYLGSLLLLFVPGLHLCRGGAAAMLTSVYEPFTSRDYYVSAGLIAISGATALWLVRPLCRLTLKILEAWGYRCISAIALWTVIILVLSLTGPAGLGIMLIATLIGLIPALFGCRRMNTLGLILLPMACIMSGIGTTVAEWMGLL